MANLTTSLGAGFGFGYVATTFLARFGQREVFLGRDFRKRYYTVHPLIECTPGAAPGHLEILLLRKWLVVLKKAR
jgi:hypothetical protein